MTIQSINVGTGPNDHTGDPLRTAFIKINSNFSLVATQEYVDSSYATTSYVDAAIAGISSVTDGATPPSGAAAGDLWYDTTDGRLYIYFDSTWVDASPVDGVGSGGISITDFGEGFSLAASNKIVTNKLYSTNETQSTQHYRLELDTNGVVVLPDQSVINGATLRVVPGTGELNYAALAAGSDSNHPEKTWIWVDTNGAWVSTDSYATNNTWKFQNDGKFILPVGGDIVASDGVTSVLGGGASTGDITFDNSKLTSSTSQNFLNLDGTGEVGLVTVSTNNIHIRTDFNDNNNHWQFGSDGNLTLPEGGDIVDSNGDTVLGGSPDRLTNGIHELVLNVGGAGPYITFPADDGASISIQGCDITGAGFEVNLLSAEDGVRLSANATSDRKDWLFGTDGTTTFPNNTIKNDNDLNISAGTDTVGISEGSLEFIGDGTILLSPGVVVGGVGDTGYNPFTIDAWVKFSEDPATHYQFILGTSEMYNGDYNDNGFSLFVGDGQPAPSATKITIDCLQVSNTQFDVPALTTDTWYHIAVARNSSGIVSVWVNGVRSTTGARGLEGGPVAFTGVTDQIGSWSYNGTTQMLGNVGQVRIVTDNNIYDPNDSTITVPTADLQEVTGTQLLLLMKSSDQYGDDTGNNTLSVYDMAGSTTLPAWTTDAPTIEIPTTWTFGTDGRTTFPNGTVPEHSYGAAGDKEGMVVFTDPYIYYCKQDYVDDVTDIWVRVAWTGTNW